MPFAITPNANGLMPRERKRSLIAFFLSKRFFKKREEDKMAEMIDPQNTAEEVSFQIRRVGDNALYLILIFRNPRVV